MSAELDLISALNPHLNDGAYVFTLVTNINEIPRGLAIMEFQEEEGTTLIITKEKADHLGLAYDYVSSWITLKSQTALDAIGITAAFARILADHQISCNVVAGYHHDHIFIPYEHRLRAIKLLTKE